MKLISKTILALVFIAASAVGVRAFSLLGPLEAWQVERIGHDLAGDIGGVKDLGEGYRWNTPTLTYAFDQSFVNYFGSNGMAAVDRAIELLNNLPPASTIRDDGTHLLVNGQRVPFDTRFRNFELQTLGLWDVKSLALSLLLEEMGLAMPERWVWTLRGRSTFGNPPITNYVVFKQNFDPITLQPSSVVNGTVYTYEIFEFQNPDIADAIEFPLDPLAFGFTSVAGFNLFSGEFYAGLTHDDVGGLKFLYNTNNLAVEGLLPTVTGGQPATGSSPWAPFLGTTNFFFIGTNFFFNTNIFGTNNLIITGLRPGVNKVRFQKVAFDSIVGQNFTTITNKYTDTTISNARPVIQPVQRTIPTPDVLFLVEDLGLVQGAPVFSSRTSTDSWINNDAINGNSALGGPGVIAPPVQITFTSLFPVFLNQNPGFADEFSASPVGVWATFDETVDEPILYPAYGNLTLDDLRDIVLGSGGGN